MPTDTVNYDLLLIFPTQKMHCNSYLYPVIKGCLKLACVASVSMWFRSKERGMRVKDPLKQNIKILINV